MSCFVEREQICITVMTETRSFLHEYVRLEAASYLHCGIGHSGPGQTEKDLSLLAEM